MLRVVNLVLTFFNISYLRKATVASLILLIVSATNKVLPDIDLNNTRVLLWLRQDHRRVIILWCRVRIYRILLSTVFLQLSFQGL